MPRAGCNRFYRACVSLLRRAAVALAAAATLSTALAAPLAVPAVAEQPKRDLGPTSYAGAGPYAVGERTLRLGSGVKVEVWYPAKDSDVAGLPEATYDIVEWLPDQLKEMLPEGASVTYPSGGVRGVRVASGKFPLVVFSHGYAGFRTQSSELTSALASWGFVVAAPDHPSRNLTKVLFGPPGTTSDLEDLAATITMMSRKNTNAGSVFRRHLDLDHVGVVGHSAGGRAVENLAVTDKRVDTFVGMAGASVGALDEEAPKVPRVPGLLLAATDDGIVGLDRMDRAYAAMKKPKRIVYFGGFGHLVFSDLCEVGESDGGLLAIADLLGVPVTGQLALLATDGCVEPATDPTLAWPAVQHVVVAHLRHVFGTDRSGAALTGLDAAYPGVVSGARSAGE